MASQVGKGEGCHFADFDVERLSYDFSKIKWFLVANIPEIGRD